MKFDFRPAAIPAARRHVVTAYAATYVVVLLTCIRIWSADPNLIYVGRDSDFSLWLARAYLDWAHPFSATTLNPLQGMVSTLMPMNPNLNPGAWVFQTDLKMTTKFVISMIVYFFEVTVSCILLGRIAGFSWAFSFAAALWVIVLYFPPFNFVFGLQGVVATSAQWAHALAVCNLILILFILIGWRGWVGWAGRIYAAALNIILATGMVALLLLYLLTAPFYNGGTLPGLVLLCGIVLLTSSDMSQFVWRAGTGLYALVVFYALGVFEFFAASKTFTARFAGGDETSLPQFHWPVDLSVAAWAAARDWLCDAAVLCGRLTNPGALTGAHWLHVAIVAGGIAVWYSKPPPLGRMSGLFALAWFGLLLFWLLCALRIISDVAISPIYIVVPLQPFWAFFSLYSIWLVVAFMGEKIVALAPLHHIVMPAWKSSFALPVAVVMGSIVIGGGYGAYLARRAPAQGYFTQRGAFESRKTSPIVDRLREEVALRPGDSFRGSVATILGAKRGSLRRLLGLPEASPLAPGKHEAFLSYAIASTGNDHTLLDMWWLDIPTLAEYAQGISRQYMFYMTHFLRDQDDPDDVSVALPYRPNVDVLRAMGVRFIIIDRELTDADVTLSIKQSFRGAEIYLYEIARPNLGNYSPIDIVHVADLDSLRAIIEGNPGILASSALLQTPIEGPFVPARNARMIFEKGAVRITASSNARSMLLLPVQFTHCLTVSDPNVQVLRAGLIFTLIVFDGLLDTRLNWEFNFWGDSNCRAKDVADLRRFGLAR